MEWPAAARNLIPLSRFPQGASRGGDGSPHAGSTLPASKKRRQASMPPAPPPRGLRPLAPSPKLTVADLTPSVGRPALRMLSARQRTKEGRHVVLDFYDLLIELIMWRL